MTETVTAVVFFTQYKSDRHFISTFLGVYFPLLLPCSFGEANTSFKLSAKSVCSQCIEEGWQQSPKKLKKNLGSQPCLLLKNGLPSLEVISPLSLSRIFKFLNNQVWFVWLGCILQGFCFVHWFGFFSPPCSINLAGHVHLFWQVKVSSCKSLWAFNFCKNVIQRSHDVLTLRNFIIRLDQDQDQLTSTSAKTRCLGKNIGTKHMCKIDSQLPET